MKILETLGSGAGLAKALFTAANTSTNPDLVKGNVVPARLHQSAQSTPGGDRVSLSELATNLSGDGLDLFNKLSHETRSDLASLVSAGKLTAAELNDALSGLLKSARKNAFWQEAGKYQMSLSQQSVDTVEMRDAAAIEAAFAAGKPAPTQSGYLYGADAAALRARFANLDSEDTSGRNVRQNRLTPYLMSGTFAAANTATAQEVSAAEKLGSMNFDTNDLNDARQSLALESVLQMVADNKAMMTDWL